MHSADKKKIKRWEKQFTVQLSIAKKQRRNLGGQMQRVRLREVMNCDIMANSIHLNLNMVANVHNQM